MRKLILIATIAMMSTTSCYANLSVASNEPAHTVTEQPKAQAPAAAKPANVSKISSAAKPHTRHTPAVVAHPSYQVHSFSYGHCL